MYTSSNDRAYDFFQKSQYSIFQSSAFIKTNVHVEGSQKCFHLPSNGVIQVLNVSADG